MKKTLMTTAMAFALTAGIAQANGKLNIYNWGNYTSPEMIEKFEKETGIEVTIDGYDSNETMLAKVKEGNTGYDVVVPGDYMIAVMVEEGLLAETNPSEMENFKNVDPQWLMSIGIQVGNTRFLISGGRPRSRWTPLSMAETSTRWS